MARMMSVAQIVHQASLEIGITQKKAPSKVFGSDDQDIAQMGALLHAVADEVLLEDPYRFTLGDDVWVASANGTPKLAPDLDTDLILFDSRLAINGLKYRFNQAKGFEFAEQLREFVVRLNKVAGRVNAKVLDLDDDTQGRVI
jgi:hypothetical protein